MVCFGRNLKAHPVPPSCHGQGQFPVCSVPHPTWPGALPWMGHPQHLLVITKISPTADTHSCSCMQAPRGVPAATCQPGDCCGGRENDGGGIIGCPKSWGGSWAQCWVRRWQCLLHRALRSALLQPYLILYSLVCIKLNHIKAYYWTSWFNLTRVYLLSVVTLSFKIRQIKSAGQALRWRLGRKGTQNIMKTWIPKQTNAFFQAC